MVIAVERELTRPENFGGPPRFWAPKGLELKQVTSNVEKRISSENPNQLQAVTFLRVAYRRNVLLRKN